MVLTIVISSFSAFTQANNSKAKDSATADIKVPIGLLGVYHFDNPNQYQFNVKSDNVLSEKRQKEIEDLVKQSAKFKPTRIAPEFDKRRNLGDSLYQQYLKGERK